MAMDSELTARVAEMARQLAEAELLRLRQAGTFVEIEELACEIGDELSRQLMKQELAQRGVEAEDAAAGTCPDCGQASSRPESHQRKLDSTRGQIEYFEPAYHCPTCRRAFFPGSGIDRLVRASHRDSAAD